MGKGEDMQLLATLSFLRLQSASSLGEPLRFWTQVFETASILLLAILTLTKKTIIVQKGINEFRTWENLGDNQAKRYSVAFPTQMELNPQASRRCASFTSSVYVFSRVVFFNENLLGDQGTNETE